MAPRPAATQELATYLTTGYWADDGESPHHFDTSGSNVITVNLTALAADAQTLARSALEAWRTVANVTFREVASGGLIAFDDDEDGAFSGSSYDGAGHSSDAHVNISSEWVQEYGRSIGAYAFQSYLHEIGHVLGLGHAGNYNSSADYGSDAIFQIDSWQQSVMSYFSQDENTDVVASDAYALGPAMADILAVQQLYGTPNGGPTAGNTTWGLGSNLGTYIDAVFRSASAPLASTAMTIYDEGGIDTIDFSNDVSGQYLNMNIGQFSSVYGGVGNLAIALNTVIENYRAGQAADQVIGNGAGNCLFGNGGNDLLSGMGGRDRLDGGTGRDQLSGGQGKDTFVFSSGRDTVLGFANNTDILALDNALWHGRKMSVDKVLSTYAHVSHGDVVLAFGNGDTVRLDGFTKVSALADDLVFV